TEVEVERRGELDAEPALDEGRRERHRIERDLAEDDRRELADEATRAWVDLEPDRAGALEEDLARWQIRPRLIDPDRDALGAGAEVVVGRLVEREGACAEVV